MPIPCFRARPERDISRPHHPIGIAIEMPVGISTRPPRAVIGTASRANRSSPASPSCAYAGNGSSESSRTRSMGSGTTAKRTLTGVERPGERPPSVDALARSLADSGLPHPILVDIARAAIADRDPGSASARADEFRRTLLSPVVNATGVLLHTNLGRAPLSLAHPARPQTIEFDLATGDRGSRQQAVGQLFA